MVTYWTYFKPPENTIPGRYAPPPIPGDKDRPPTGRSLFAGVCRSERLMLGVRLFRSSSSSFPDGRSERTPAAILGRPVAPAVVQADVDWSRVAGTKPEIAGKGWALRLRLGSEIFGAGTDVRWGVGRLVVLLLIVTVVVRFRFRYCQSTKPPTDHYFQRQIMQ